MSRWRKPVLWLVGGVSILVLGLFARWFVLQMPSEAERKLAAAQQALAEGRFLSAAQSFAEAAERDPGQPGLWSQAGSAALQGGDAQTAITYFEREPQPTNYDRFLLGQAYQQTGNLEQAVAYYQQAATLEAYTALWQIHQSQNDYPAIQSDLLALLAFDPNNANYHYQLGLILAARQPDEALPHLVTAAQLDPTLSEAQTALNDALRTSRYYDDPAYTFLACGRVLATLDEWALAAEAFRQAVQQDKTYGEAWAYLGEANQHLGQSGTNELLQALTLSPKSIAVNMLAALYWQRQGNLDQALAYLDAAAKLEPANPVIQAELGRVAATQGDLQLAETYYRHAIELTPTDPTYYRLLAEFFLRYDIQLHEMALPAARQAVLLNPNDPANLDLLAQVLLRLDDPLTAERFLLQAQDTAPNDPAVLLHLGQVYWLKGDRQLARQEWQQVLTLAPNSTWAAQAQSWLAR
jgi:tetratricopeptide (TPR) repeat protein